MVMSIVRRISRRIRFYSKISLIRIYINTNRCFSHSSFKVITRFIIIICVKMRKILNIISIINSFFKYLFQWANVIVIRKFSWIFRILPVFLFIDCFFFLPLRFFLCEFRIFILLILEILFQHRPCERSYFEYLLRLATYAPIPSAFQMIWACFYKILHRKIDRLLILDFIKSFKI